MVNYKLRKARFQKTTQTGNLLGKLFLYFSIKSISSALEFRNLVAPVQVTAPLESSRKRLRLASDSWTQSQVSYRLPFGCRITSAVKRILAQNFAITCLSRRFSSEPKLRFKSLPDLFHESRSSLVSAITWPQSQISLAATEAGSSANAEKKGKNEFLLCQRSLGVQAVGQILVEEHPHPSAP